MRMRASSYVKMHRVCWSLRTCARPLGLVISRSFESAAAESSPSVAGRAERASEQSADKHVVEHVDMPFDEFVKVKRRLRTRKRVAGLPFAFAGLTGSSMLHAWLNPHMFDATSPDQLTIYLYVLHCTVGLD